jgi:site-specific DNA-methyltransferase (adenine-specific)
MKTIIKKSELKSIYDIDCPTWKPIIEKYDGWVIDKTAGSPADLWNGNAVEILKTIQSETIDLIVTDPPYKIITGGDSNGKNSTRPKGILSGNRKLMKFIPKFSEWLPECYRVLKNGTHAYFMINSTNLTEMLVEVEKAGFKIHNILIWKKNNCTPSQFYMKNCEYIIFCRKGKAKYINNIGGSKTVHDFNNIIGNKVHPTEKPVELMSVYVENSSNENDIVLDPFMGAGSTGVACLKLNRKFIGIEIEINYFDIAKNRLMEIGK